MVDYDDLNSELVYHENHHSYCQKKKKRIIIHNFYIELSLIINFKIFFEDFEFISVNILS